MGRSVLVLASAILLLDAVPTRAQGPPACGPGPLFEHLPLALDEFHAFRPLGFLSSPIHVVPAWHSAFSRKSPGETRPVAQVRFPGEALVVSVFAVEFLSSGATGYQLRFQPCQEVLAYFNHLGTLSPRLLAAVRETPGQCSEYNDGSGLVRNCRHGVAVPVAAGEEVGFSDDTAGVDFGLIDYRLPPAGFANPAHYSRDFFYYASPVGYFAPEPRAALEARLASYDGTLPRTAEPRVGTHMQDLPGTAQGTWFAPGASFVGASNESRMIALVHDYIGADQPILSFGSELAGLRPGLASFDVERAGRVNRDFSEIAADGQVYCFDRFRSGQSVGKVPLGDPGGLLLLTLPTPSTLRLERQGAPGSRCSDAASWSFSTAALEFER